MRGDETRPDGEVLPERDTNGTRGWRVSDGAYFPPTTFRLCDCPYSSSEGTITTRRDYSLGLFPHTKEYRYPFQSLIPIPHTHGRETDTFLLIVSVYVLSPDGASFVQTPLPWFTPTSLSWNPNGDSFLLGYKRTFCVAFLGGAPSLSRV